MELEITQDQAQTAAPPTAQPEPAQGNGWQDGQQSTLEKATEAERLEWRKTGKLPEPAEKAAPATAKTPSENAPDADTGKSQGDGKPSRVETRKQALSAEIQELHTLLQRRAALREQLRNTGDQPGTTPAGPEQPKAAAGTDGKPKMENFETIEDYTEAMADWKLAQHQAKLANDAKAREHEQTEQQRLSALAERRKAFQAEVEDFDQVIQTAAAMDIQGPASDTIGAFIEDSPHGMEMAYLFGKNLETYEQVVNMTPANAIRVLRDIEVGIESRRQAAQPAATPAKATATRAPAPVVPIASGTKTATTDPVDAALAAGNFGEYRRLMNLKQYGSRAAVS